ncbi:NDR1/HIN1-like protein 6 [Triticum dicoccoides]|uniref:NDR1/HIN1-like protein 6 n=1 Tax=Triticum dicoccoides TaxID=85692 RepID=UPI00188F044C|nr:NDR1/HIN1-like protein 6 [Triticum dicoccoides]
MAALDAIHEHNERDLEAGHATPPSSLVKEKARRRNSCHRFAWVALLVTAAVTIALGAFLGVLYVALDPKMPLYTVHALNVTAFGMDNDMTARARFDAAVRFENPNRAIGISYEEGSSLAVWYGGYRLSEGALPAFYQGHRDSAVVHVAMSEARLGGTGVVEAMRHVNGAGGELPLVFQGEVPVRVKVGPVTTAKVTPRVRCDLVLDRLSTEGGIGVKRMSCNLKLW